MMGLIGVNRRLIASDRFNRADSALTMGSLDTGQPWVMGQGTGGILSNEAYFPSKANSDHAYVETGSPGGVFAAGCTGNAAGTHRACVMVRYADLSNFILAFVDQLNVLNLYKSVAGVGSTVATVASGVTYSVKHTIEVRPNGTAVEVLVNGVSKIIATIAELTGNTKHGILYSGTGGSIVTFDDWQQEVG